jgi:release factor glutamine methyltransferase
VRDRLAAAGCVFADEEAGVLLSSGENDAGVEAMIARRVAGEPLEYVVGWAEFDGLRIPVRPGVFIPRRRTHALLVEALRMLAPGARVLDLCCGAGPVAAALLRRRPDLRVCASDVDPEAVECARALVPDVYCGDLFAPIPRQGFDLIVANAPYVPTDSLTMLPRESRAEAFTALDGGPDGLDIHRRIAAQATEWLQPGGSVLTEVSPGQVDSLKSIYARYEVTARVDEDLEVAVVRCAVPVPK